jgi:hypothetical protein
MSFLKVFGRIVGPGIFFIGEEYTLLSVMVL